MNVLSQYFQGRSRVLLPVVHVETYEQAARNVDIAVEAGADGVFLIAHGAPHQELLDITARMCARLPEVFIGVNCLDLRPHEVVGLLPPGVRGIWSDNAYVSLDGDSPLAQRFAEERSRCGWEGLYFGGVAFKYQKQAGTPAQATRAALRYVDVVCTSGPGTGMAMSADKAQEMREAAQRHPLAVASGITCENVHLFLPYVDAYLVATGISDSHTELNPSLTARLTEIVHAWQPSREPDV